MAGANGIINGGINASANGLSEWKRMKAEMAYLESNNEIYQSMSEK